MPNDTFLSRGRYESRRRDKGALQEAIAGGFLAQPEGVARRDGQLQNDGSMVYEVLCSRKVDPTRVFFRTVVPPYAADDVHLAAEAEVDAARERLAELLSPRQ